MLLSDFQTELLLIAGGSDWFIGVSALCRCGLGDDSVGVGGTVSVRLVSNVRLFNAGLYHYPNFGW